MYIMSWNKKQIGIIPQQQANTFNGQTCNGCRNHIRKNKCSKDKAVSMSFL